MIETLKGTVLAAVFLAVLLAGSPASASAREQDAMVRVAHLSSDAPNVDVYVNDEPVDALTNVPYKTISRYLPLSAGNQNVKVYAAGDGSEPLISTDVDLQSGAAYTIGAVGLVGDGSLKAQVYKDDNSLPGRGDAKLRVVHAVPDVASVDIYPLDGEPLFTALGFPNATRYAEVPADTYTLEVYAAGTDMSVCIIPGATLSPNVVHSAFVVGQADDDTLEVLISKDAGTSSGGGSVALNVAMGDMPTAAMPETGGVSPILLASGIVCVVTGFLVRRLHRS